jgi:hypothetical protein
MLSIVECRDLRVLVLEQGPAFSFDILDGGSWKHSHVIAEDDEESFQPLRLNERMSRTRLAIFADGAGAALQTQPDECGLNGVSPVLLEHDSQNTNLLLHNSWNRYPRWRKTTDMLAPAAPIPLLQMRLLPPS